MSTWSASVTGLTCQGCVTTVTQQMSAIDGVGAINVDLVKGGVSTVSVESSRDLSDTEVGAALSAGGASTSFADDSTL